ncbi:lipid-A-disaccharide synthase N-terminal domain-containing protein [Dysgonomonas sp. 25]|uniref:lipid-A-disaccharide synthase N-terminal domain-containing protein n=1 Tax=Dysgonomonas sp. 25 TaxID=2302933 RepID=UPI0013D0F0E3|nr:lipid-A-disaccharide synthase N-terminal domain-containing protein [Dysgonomonas sp. 25]NDV70310.1 lauroyl acyltransferase [Dysgonomonas sp. 25]
MTDNWWIFAIGFAAQLLFSARMLIQWLMSEKARQVVSPAVYWQLSLLAAILFLAYGWLRNDFAIILGQFISYYIYIWNLNEKGDWKKVHRAIRLLIYLIPLAALTYVFVDIEMVGKRLFDFANISLPLLLFGSFGQIIFVFRFIYQWQYSRTRHQSLLPRGFWLMSIVGSLAIVTYGIFRNDPVLIVGHSVGFIIYSRNWWLAKRQQ